MNTPLPLHLVGVWNPSYAADAMQAHTSLLLDWTRRWRDRQAEEDARFVWWGLVRSEQRQHGLPHLDRILALGQELSDEGRELQFYLTDYRSLYVAQVASVTAEDVVRRDPAHVPRYYHDLEPGCECWFALADIRRLVAEDTVSVIRELRSLRNTAYHDRPVSLYGGMVNLPLLVVRPDGRRFFDGDEMEAVIDDRLWAEFDAEQGGVGAMERELRENLLGDEVWSRLDPATRTVLASAEKMFRDHRGEPGFDFAAVLGLFAKALEIETNARMHLALDQAPAAVRMYNLDGHSADLAVQRLTLGQLARALSGDKARHDALTQFLNGGSWFAGSLPPILKQFADLRNTAIHSARVDREAATHWRNRFMGVGSDGVFVRLAWVERRG